MSILISSLREELETSRRLEKKYLAKLSDLPQGSFHIRKVRDKSYGYLTKRENGKVVQEYLGAMQAKQIAEYRQHSEKKKKYKEQLKKVRDQIKLLEKVVENGKTI